MFILRLQRFSYIFVTGTRPMAFTLDGAFHFNKGNTRSCHCLVGLDSIIFVSSNVIYSALINNFPPVLWSSPRPLADQPTSKVTACMSMEFFITSIKLCEMSSECILLEDESGCQPYFFLYVLKSDGTERFGGWDFVTSAVLCNSVLFNWLTI